MLYRNIFTCFLNQRDHFMWLHEWHTSHILACPNNAIQKCNKGGWASHIIKAIIEACRIKGEVSNTAWKRFKDQDVGVGTSQLCWKVFRKVHVCSDTRRTVHGPEGNLESILSTRSRCLWWFSLLIRSCIAATWLIRLFCISLSWSINLCSRASSCACMAASISLSCVTVADTNVETCSITVVLRLFFSSGTVYASKQKKCHRASETPVG